MTALREHVLVLNKGWIPITTTTVKRALTLMYIDAARAVCPDSYTVYTFEDWLSSEIDTKEEAAISTVQFTVKVPEIIVLTNYIGIPRTRVLFSRRALARRDGKRCAYCNVICADGDLTIDHVVPVSRGGDTSWQNCVTACKDCNQKKGDRTPHEADMPLRYLPFEPVWAPHNNVPARMRRPSWDKFLKRNKKIKNTK